MSLSLVAGAETRVTRDPHLDDDVEAIARYRAGDARAFDELVRRHQRAVFGLCRRYVRQDADAKDLAQRAFVKAFQGLPEFRGGSSFRTWLYRIAVNLSLNFLRDHARRPAGELTDDLLVADAVGADRLEDAEARARLRAALDDLPAKQRLVLELRVFEDLPFKEVAVIAECSENAAKVNFHFAVKRLRERLRP